MSWLSQVEKQQGDESESKPKWFRIKSGDLNCWGKEGDDGFELYVELPDDADPDGTLQFTYNKSGQGCIVYKIIGARFYKTIWIDFQTNFGWTSQFSFGFKGEFERVISSWEVDKNDEASELYD